MVNRKMSKNIFPLFWSSLGCFAHAHQPQAQSESFYNGKTVRIIVGFTPGGFYDRWARLLSRYMPKYIPGNPNFLVQNMPGRQLGDRGQLCL